MPQRRARSAKTGELLESAFQKQVEGLAKVYGWLRYHTHDSRRSHAGFPDLVLLRGPELIFAELKTDRGRIRPEQQDWIDALQLVPGVDVYLWRPKDWDALHARLARGRRHLPEFDGRG